MRALAVVVLEVHTQDVFEIAAADDQEPVETLVADGADEPLEETWQAGRRHTFATGERPRAPRTQTQRRRSNIELESEF